VKRNFLRFASKRFFFKCKKLVFFGVQQWFSRLLRFKNPNPESDERIIQLLLLRVQ